MGPFGFHPLWLVVLLVIVLIIFGPGKLPELGGAIGRGIREFNKTRNDLTEQVTSAVHETPSKPAETSAAPKESAAKADSDHTS